MLRFRLHTVAAILILLAAAQLTYLSNRGGQARALPGSPAVMDLSLTPVRWLSWPFRMMARGWRRYVALVGTERENRELKDKLAELEIELQRLRDIESAQERLRSLLDLKETLPYEVIGAELATRTSDGTADVVYLVSGKRAGVSPPAAVVAPSGLVGRVVGVSGSFSRILPITDPSSAVGVFVQRTRVQGVMRGTGRRLCRMEHVSVAGDVVVGDRVVTSGLDGIYPKGLEVGLVSVVDRPPGAFFADIEIVPSARISQIEEVLVVSDPSFQSLPTSGEVR